MTDEHDPAGLPEAGARPGELIKRIYAAELEAGDGRTIDVRIVPYGVPATVADVPGRPYREEWAAGCFDHQVRASDKVKVLMNFEHQPGLAGMIGRGTALRSAPDGLHGTFRIFENSSDGDKALELVREGVLDGISLEAYARKSVRTAEGVMRRERADLVNVALCRNPAFEDARVLAVRQEVIFDEALLPLELDQAQLERARALGIKLPAPLAARLEPES